MEPNIQVIPRFLDLFDILERVIKLPCPVYEQLLCQVSKSKAFDADVVGGPPSFELVGILGS